MREILLAIGEDPDREGLRETPDRVARMYEEMFAGLRKDPAVVLRKTFTEKYDEMVLVKNIGFESMCEHHLLPFFGKAHIALSAERPDRRPEQTGPHRRNLSRRPQVQERMTEELADLVMQELECRAASASCWRRRIPAWRSAACARPSSVCTTSRHARHVSLEPGDAVGVHGLIQTGK